MREMNAQHLERLTRALEDALPDLSRSGELQFKPLFGAVAGYVDGRIFISGGNFGLALKLPSRRCAALLAEQGCEPLRYFPKGHVKKNYVVLPERITGEKTRLRALVNESIRYVTESTR